MLVVADYEVGGAGVIEQQEYLRCSSTTVTTSSTRSFFTRNLIKKDNARDEDPKDRSPKGPLGLTTLFSPEDGVVADLVFVHGLNGGSQSTWCKGNASLFWPKEWLTKDAAFKDVRIHTFGYSSAIGRESILNIQDFASSLLAGIQDCPSIPRNDDVRVTVLCFKFFNNANDSRLLSSWLAIAWGAW